MPNLVEKYFIEDLTEAEQEAFSQSLLNSDEAALKFEAMAKETYAQFGLPEPQPRWDDSANPPSAPGAGWKSWIFPALLVLGLAGFICWWKGPFAHLPRFSNILGFIKSSPEGLLNKPATSVSSWREGIQMATGSNLKRNQVSGKSEDLSSKTKVEEKERVTGLKTAASANPQPVRAHFTPVNVDLNPSETFSGLSVEVGQAQAGLVTVRVLDPRKAEIVVLYKGSLAPGNWRFDWDGQLKDGSPATPGYYQIEVQSGTFVQAKNIQIQ